MATHKHMQRLMTVLSEGVGPLYFIHDFKDKCMKLWTHVTGHMMHKDNKFWQHKGIAAVQHRYLYAAQVKSNYTATNLKCKCNLHGNNKENI
jgi:hypothetical protein